MGRRAKAPSEKRLTGASKRKVRSTAAASTAAAETAAEASFAPPPWLTDRAALGVWNRIAPELARLNMLAKSDRDTFGRYCFHFAGFIATLKAAPIGKEYTDVPMTGGVGTMPRLHPAVKAREVHERHLIEIEDRFGGSPLARYRLIAQQAAHPGAFGDLFGARQPDAPAPAQPGDAAPPPASPIGTLRSTTQH